MELKKNKHKQKLLFIIGLLISSFSFGQEIFPKDFPNELPERFLIHLNMDSVDYYQQNKKIAKTNKLNSLSYINQFTKKEIFENGTIGVNYTVIEIYLNEIVQKIIPQTLIEKLNIHVYASIEPEINAYALSDGTILFNVHNFIYLDNEAQVASILAHEIGHHLNESNAEQEWLTYMNSFDFFNGKKRKYEMSSQNAEINADKKSADMLTASGYNNYAAISTEELFLTLENKMKQLLNYKRLSYLKTHPPSEQRLDSAKAWITEVIGENYLVDSTLFFQIKKGSRMHSINKCLTQHDYFTCLELSIEGYLSELNNEYSYYIAESIRRLIYTKQVNNPTLTIFSGIYKGIYQLGLYKVLNDKIFLTKSEDKIRLELHNARVFSYSKVQEHFNKLAIESGNKEALLTKGLYNYSKKKKNNEYIKKYIVENGENSKWAKELIIPNKNKQAKSLLIFNKINTIHCSGKKPIKLYFLEESFNKTTDSLSSYLYNEICPYKDKIYISSENYLHKNYKEALFFKSITTLVRLIEKKKINFSIVDPSLGEFICKNSYTVVQYYDINYVPCTNAGLSVLAAIGGVSTTPSAYSISYFSYNNKKNKYFGSHNVSLGELTESSLKYKLKSIINKNSYK